ncbi:sugar transferase [Oceanobacillus manasiensis]|uniref:sugar transferase n=1 Tax=Oceanobacillus manasiensis TaxID=586413 RepID=UPI0005A8B431|nr:sugar transferase [Oceanobacillus manasiensis]
MELQRYESRISKPSTEKKRVYSLVKRMLDVLMSFILLILFAPLMLIIAKVIHNKEGSPVIARSWRVGVKERPFLLYEFRTFSIPSRVITAFPKPASISRSQYKRQQLMREKQQQVLTPIGKVLRKYKLHKLPLLWNVFKGDMSFVGPIPVDKETVLTYDQYEYRRMMMKPGIIGFTRVYTPGLRKDLKIEQDLYYMKYRSLKMDLIIFLRAIRRLLKNTTAK